MKERPIIFSADMVHAILDGRKTQTRRFMKPQPHPDATLQGLIPRPNADRACASFAHVDERGVHSHSLKVNCPFGRCNHHFWVRETWFDNEASDDGSTDETPKRCVYRADGEFSKQFPGDYVGTKWRPSIHMPRWASRITLEITGVRVERLGKISREDAIAEGAPPSHPSIDCVSREFGYDDFSRSWFAQLWESIHGAGSWFVNPWVWVIEFQRVGGEG